MLVGSVYDPLRQFGRDSSHVVFSLPDKAELGLTLSLLNEDIADVAHPTPVGLEIAEDVNHLLKIRACDFGQVASTTMGRIGRVIDGCTSGQRLRY